MRKVDPQIRLGVLHNNYILTEKGRKIRDPTPTNFAEYVLVNRLDRNSSGSLSAIPATTNEDSGHNEDNVVRLCPGMDAVHMCAETITKKEVEEAHEMGVSVLVWFPAYSNLVEDERTFAHLERLGVDTVCTNRPDQFYKS